MRLHAVYEPSGGQRQVLKPTVIPLLRLSSGTCFDTYTRMDAAAAAVEQNPRSEELRRPLEGAPGRPPTVALGKFDALHKGHRCFTYRASRKRDARTALIRDCSDNGAPQDATTCLDASHAVVDQELNANTNCNAGR